MGGLFDLQSPFWFKAGKVVDLLWLGLLWAVCCAGVFTAAPATAALFYAIKKSVRDDRGYATKEYFRGFRDNFKQGSLLWLIWAAVVLIMCMDVYMTYQFLMAGKAIGYLFYFFLVMICFLIMWGCYLFTYIARFADGTRRVLKNTALMMLRHFKWSLLLLLLVLVAGFLVYCYPLLFFLAGAVLMFLESLVLEHVYAFYIPKEGEEGDG